MIRLSLPAYDAKQPLSFELAGHVHNTGGQAFGAQIQIRLWAGGFAGNVVREVTMAVAPTVGMALAQGSATINLPDALGLTGGEGWFSVEPTSITTGYVFIHDVVVTYTPAGAAHVKAQGHFS